MTGSYEKIHVRHKVHFLNLSEVHTGNVSLSHFCCRTNYGKAIAFTHSSKIDSLSNTYRLGVHTSD